MITASKKYISTSNQLHTVAAQGNTMALAYAALLARVQVMKPSSWVIGSGTYTSPVTDLTDYVTHGASGEAQDMIINLVRLDANNMVIDRAAVQIKDATTAYLVANTDGVANHAHADIAAIAAAYQDANNNAGWTAESAFYVD